MKIGVENISSVQLEYLREAQEARSLPAQINAIMAVIKDSEIEDETEDLHPGWVEVFEAISPQLGQFPEKISWVITSFFAGLSSIEKGVRELNPSSDKIAFLLGAGASKPDPSNIPTVKELLGHLIERAKRLDRQDVTQLADFCADRKIDNIEDLLTAAQLARFCTHNPAVLALVDYLLFRKGESFSPEARLRRGLPPRDANLYSVAFLQDTLQVLFGLLSSTMLPALPNGAHKAIAQYVKEHASPGLVTTNYDCCMDLALGKMGKAFHYDLEFKNDPHPHAGVADCIRLVKLHGSLNWFYCETCQDIQVCDPAVMVEAYQRDQSPYPVIGICTACGGQRRGLLVPPLAMKFDLAPPLIGLAEKAADVFGSASLIVVVGFSFAEADVYISRMVSKSMQTNKNQKMLIVDPSKSVAERVRRKFEASIPKFTPSRIMHLTGDCADKLPKFLTGEFFEKAAAVSPEQGHDSSKPRRVPRTGN